MAYHLSTAAIEQAIAHLCRYGDTDIFPHLPELAFFSDERVAVVAEIAKLDLDSYYPAGAIEALAPKSRYGFRIAHQLSAVDTLLLLACVVEIGEKIEKKRQPATASRAFSYRFAPDATNGQLFRSDRTYKDWLHKQQALIIGNRSIRKIISTDISDYYSRINFHRLENLLDEVASGHGASRFIKKHIRVIRAKQSFGLPVGGSAARLLAELALADTDDALLHKDLEATRFVDDYRLLLKAADDPYDALGYLAEQLGINEGLSLNVSKTTVKDRRDYLRYLQRMTSDVADEAEGVALDTLTADLYFDQEPDEEDLAKLKGFNLVEMLGDEIKVDEWDMGRIRVLFRALKIAKPKEAIEFVAKHFGDLVVFAKETCLLMQALEEETPGCFEQLVDRAIQAIATPPASSVQLIRLWLLELFVRGVIEIPLSKLKGLENLPALVDKRQLLLIRGRCDDKNYFRKQKTAIHNFSDMERPCLVWGASCLPTDEYENWIATVKSNFDRPLGILFLKWTAKNKGKLISKLQATTLDQPD
jgi:hypothetical protein